MIQRVEIRVVVNDFTPVYGYEFPQILLHEITVHGFERLGLGMDLLSSSLVKKMADRSIKQGFRRGLFVFCRFHQSLNQFRFS